MKTTLLSGLLITAAVGVAAAAPPSASRPSTSQSFSKIGNYTPVTTRGMYAGQIVSKWAGYVSTIYGTSPTAWAKSMGPTFAQADVHNMASALNRTTFEGMMSALAGQRTSDAKIIDQLARTDGSVAAIDVLGSASNDLVYTAVTPCRLFDTRVVGGPIAANSTRSFISSGANFLAQGGAATDCNIPAAVAAVVINVTAVHPPLPGYLTVFAYNQTRPLAAGVNYVPNEDNGNELIVTQTMAQAFNFSVYAYSQTDLTGDATGYFAAPIATALECVQVTGAPVSIAPGATGTALAAVCPSGFTGTSTSCEQTGGVFAIVASVTSTGCTFLNVSLTGTATAVAVTNCCRVPGR